MPSAWLNNFLASLELDPTNRQPNLQERAVEVIRRSNQYRYNTPQVRNHGYGSSTAKSGEIGDKGPSTVQRIMDVLSRPLYGVAEAVRQDIKHGGLIDPWHFGGIGDESGEAGAIVKGAALGVAGKRKTTSSDIYKAAGMGKGEGAGGFARNLVTDIALDPLTWVPGGILLRAFRGGAKAAKGDDAVSAAERVEKALGDPVAARVKSTGAYSRTLPGKPREIDLGGGPLRQPTITDPVAARVRSTGGLPRNIPQNKRRSIDLGGGPVRSQPEVVRPVTPETAVDEGIDKAAVKRIVKEESKAYDVRHSGLPPKKVQEILGDVVPNPTRNIDVAKLGVPPRAVTTRAPFKLDVAKVAAIEIARSVAPKLKGRSRDEYVVGRRLIESDEPNIPVFTTNGVEAGSVRAAQLDEYLRTGKAPIPKESEIPDFGTLTDKELDEFWSRYLVPDKKSLESLYLKQIDEEGNETLVTLGEMRRHIQRVKKERKLKDVLPDEPTTISKPADTTAWRKAAKEVGLTRSEIEKVLKTENDEEALRLLQEFADKPIRLPGAKKTAAPVAETTPKSVMDESVENFQIADAEDIVKATEVGSPAAAKAMVEAVEAQRPRQNFVLDEKGGRAVAKVAALYSELVRKRQFKNPYFNPAKQANAFRELEAALIDEDMMPGWKMGKEKLKSTSTGKAAKAKRSLTMKHLEALEDSMTAAGFPPTLYDGTPMRLSDLINAAGGIHVVLAHPKIHLTDLVGTPQNPSKFEKFLAENPEAAQLVEKAKAAHAAYTSKLAKEGEEAALLSASKAELDPSLTPSEVAAAVKEAPRVAEDVVKATTEIPNPTAAKMAAENVRQIIDRAEPPVIKATKQHARDFDRTVSTGRVTKETVKGSVAQQKVALSVAGVNPATIASEVSNAADSAAATGLLAGLMKAFKPDFMQKDLRPLLIENRSLFQSRTADWSHALNETFRKYNKSQRNTAFSALQKGLPVGDDTVKQAADEFQKVMESMFGATGFKDAVTSDVMREALTLDDINKALRLRNSKFQFKTDVVDDLGNEIKLEHWMDSWKFHDLGGQDPIEFIKQMRDAVDHAMLEKTIFDQIATIFGKTTGKTQFNHPRLQGVEFDLELRPQVRRFMEVWDDINKPNSRVMQYYDSGLRAWKSGVTIYSLSHHWRNLVGDMTLAWLAGVNNPRVYAKAASVLKSQRHLYRDMEKIDDLIAPGGTKRALLQQAKVKVVRAAGRDLDAEQVYKIMYDKGLLPHSRVVEDIPTGVSELKLPQPLGGRGKKVARNVSETREHFVRTAHFIDALSKSKAKTVEEAIEEATRITRKWHPDGLDLTDFEHRWMRRVFPFYSWTRKAVPLIVEGAVKKPAKITAPNKALYNLQISMGIDPESMSEPFPVDKQFPDWIRDMAYGPVLGGGTHIIGANLNPVTSVTEQLGNDPRRGITGMLTPAIRVPGEVLSQSDWQTGQPFESMDKTEYIDKQIPLVSIANRLLGTNAAAGSVEALATGDSSAMLNHKRTEGTGGNTQTRDAFLNYLFATGIINTQTPANIKSAEFDRRDRVAAERRKLREEASRR